MTDDTANTLTQILNSLEETKAAVTDLRGEVEPFLVSVWTGLQELRATTEKIGSEQVKARSEIMSRIDRLQETVELVRDDARVNWATADTAIHRVRNSREDIDDLQKQITAMERRYQTLVSLVDELRKPGIEKLDDQ
jgi:SMC interacting uncharacterized protein involved in chromosome segregation